MARPLWFVRLLEKTFPNIKFIAKLTRIPILGKLIDLLLFKDDEIIYLPKDIVIPINSELNGQEDMVLPTKVLEYFINKANSHWIMNFCICRKSMECKDYPIELGCLFLGEAVKDINPELGRLVSKKEALDHVKKCREAGLVHMIGRNLLDKQWLGVNPGYKLLSICNCDPCCCLWRISPILNPKIGRKIQKMAGVSIWVTDTCIGCGTCLDACFVNAIKLKNNRAEISKECRGCGRCVEICPQGAIELKIDDKAYVSQTIEQLEKIIDVS
ncbi:MAG: 4Fe-4S binding protein [Candidatus Lokiarchaeota archaeon]|jgi:ferredoxin|nr:4Fe-4S binding protein [Candidatus Lokiarchaeota archaeon]